MKTLGIIQARSGSTRFPRKMFYRIAGKTIIQHVYERVSDSVTLAIVAVPHGDGQAFRELGLHVWEAPEDIADGDVLSRFVACLDDTMPDATTVVRVCGDNPLLDVSALTRLVDVHHSLCPDYAGYRFSDGAPAITRPTGYFAEAVWPQVLRTINTTTPANHKWREHVTARLYEENAHSIDWLPVPSWYYDRKTEKHTAIDTRDDLERVRRYVQSGSARS